MDAGWTDQDEATMMSDDKLIAVSVASFWRPLPYIGQACPI